MHALLMFLRFSTRIVPYYWALTPARANEFSFMSQWNCTCLDLYIHNTFVGVSRNIDLTLLTLRLKDI